MKNEKRKKRKRNQRAWFEKFMAFSRIFPRKIIKKYYSPLTAHFFLPRMSPGSDRNGSTTLQLTKWQMVWDRVTGLTSNPFWPAVSHRTHICQLLRIIRRSPGYGTDLPLSCSGHKISLIKWAFALFGALVFFLKIETFINCSVSGTFISAPI